MKLTEQQQKLVEENMGLVGKVIKDKVHGLNNMIFYTYEDLFQIGCIGLSKAAATDKGGVFSTYAYRLIWNEICDALIYASKHTAEEISISEKIDVSVYENYNATDLKVSLDEVLKNAKKDANSTVLKGIDALVMMSNGLTAKEVGERFGVAANIVTAWISKARKFLKARPDIMQLYGDIT